MPVTAYEALTAVTLTALVNRVDAPKTALTELLFPESTVDVLTTEHAQIDEVTGAYAMAPMVMRDGKALPMGELGGGSYLVETPMISIKRSLTCSDALYQRQAGGTTVFQGTGEDVFMQNLTRRIAKDADYLDKAVAMRLEWMVAQAIRGTMSYTTDHASYSVDFKKPAENTFAAKVLWDTNSGTPEPRLDIISIGRLASTGGVAAPTIAVGGKDAATALDALINAKVVITDDSASTFNPDAKLIAKFAESGMRYIATIGGVKFFEYNAFYIDDVTSATTQYIRTNYFEFFPETPQAVSNRTLFYGRIPATVSQIQEGLDIGKKMMYSKEETDPPQYVLYEKSRPLPWFLRADENFSLQVAADPT